MKNVIKIAMVLLAVILVAAFSIIYILVIKPDNKAEENKNNFKISALEKTSGGDCIHFLNTGSSDAILLESNGRFAMIDCAEDTDNPRGFKELELDGYEQEVLEYVKKVAGSADGTVYLDFVLGTHSHSDHIGGFDTLIGDDNIKIGRAYLKVYDETKIKTNEVENWDNKEVYEQMVNALNEKNVPIISDIPQKSFKLGKFDITLFNIEYDNSGNKVGENDNSLGVLVEKAGVRIFLSGDMNNETGDEEKFCKQIGKIDILKVGHHSYSGSTTKAWLKELCPELCIVTNSDDKTDKHTLRRITRICNSTILTTGGENGIVVMIDDNGRISCFNNIQ